MQRLILSTTICAALILPAAAGLAQTTTTGSDPMTITAPDGFERQDMVLTADNLLNARIYDATGNSVGEIDDLVLASTAAPATDSTTVTATPSEPMTTETAPDTAETGDGAATNDTATDNSGTDNTATDNTATDNSGATVTTAPAATGTGTAEADATTTGEISHAIVDVGGFLGMGEHRVALPVADLEIYKNDNEIRVYLPWTEDQLRTLPAYVAGDLSTLGLPMSHSN